MRKGFTLIELIVVIAIIAVLAAIIAPNVFRAIEKAKISASLADFRSIKTAVMSFYADIGDWPEEEGLAAGAGGRPVGIVVNEDLAGSAIEGWDGPYIEQWPTKDRWGGKYAYQNDNTTNWDAVAGNDFARYIDIPDVPFVF